MFADNPEEPQNVRNQVLSICDLKQVGDVPAARGCGKMVTIANSMYLFGGVDEKTIFADLYKLEIGQVRWSRLLTSGDIPPGCFGHSFHAIGPDELILFGGFAYDSTAPLCGPVPFGPWTYPGNVSSDIYILNTQSLVWRKISSTLSRIFHASCFNPDTNELVVHGGYTDASFTTVSDEMYSFNVATQEWVQRKSFSPRAGHAMCVAGSIYLFGGPDSDLYKVSVDYFQVSIVNVGNQTAPSARQFCSLESVGDKIFCFGGESANVRSTDMYVWSSGMWSKPLYENALSLRCHQSSVLGDKQIVFGGLVGEGKFTRKLFFHSVLSIPSSENSEKFKLVTVGDSGVGKSCLLNRFVSDVYNEFQVSTIGVDFKTVATMVSGKLVRLQLWDTAGQEKFAVVTGNYYRGADGFVIVYDATNRSSFEHVSLWMTQIKQHHDCGPETVLILCANKQDRVKDVIVSEAEGIEKANEIAAVFVPTSAKNSANVDLAFLTAAQKLVETRKAVSNVASTHVSLGSRPPRPNSQSTCC